MTCENIFCVIVHTFHKISFKLYFRKTNKASLLSTSFYQATSLVFIMILSWLEIIASYMANLKWNLSVQVAAMSSIKPEQTYLLFTIINSLKYKFVLHLLKEDGRNRSVSVYNDIKTLFNTYYYKIPVVHRRSTYL